LQFDVNDATGHAWAVKQVLYPGWTQTADEFK
jgi:hypothetical protein